MNKQTLFVTLTTAALMCGCQSSKVKISGRFIGSDAKNVYLENASPLKQALIDAAQDNENWKYSLRDLPEMLEAVCGYYKHRFNVDTITPDES